ncbi:MAG: pyruvate kinase [Ignavibacteriaceae bacterium]|nr:pyruvate kinase [Ignavibacteriaceae bacterium]
MNKKLVEIFAKTKILSTLGPSTQSAGCIKNLIEAGIDGVRLNFSHGNYSFFEKLYEEINKACIDEETPLAVVVDLQGPKIRIGELSKPEIQLSENDVIEITTDNIVGNEKIISTSYKPLPQDAEIGNTVLIDDGLIKLKVIEKKNNSVVCIVQAGGVLKPKKGMNLPGMKLSAESFTEKDRNDILFAVKHRLDFIALSFVRSANDVISLREWLKSQNAVRPIIAKIEKKEAIDNFDEILQVADGIMIARGDLGVELPAKDVPVLQKDIIKKCNCVGKLVITATQMLESMIHNPVPTRAEASDVANAVWDGTDVVMLSGETSVGKYPVEAVRMMNDIIRNAEQKISNFHEYVLEIPKSIEANLFDSVGRAVKNISEQINANAIVAFTVEGRTARNLSKFRPKAKIISFTNKFETMNSLNLYWGVASVFSENVDKEHMAIEEAKKRIKESGHLNTGDLVIFTAGAPYSEKSRANWMRFEII